MKRNFDNNSGDIVPSEVNFAPFMVRFLSFKTDFLAFFVIGSFKQ